MDRPGRALSIAGMALAIIGILVGISLSLSRNNSGTYWPLKECSRGDTLWLRWTDSGHYRSLYPAVVERNYPAHELVWVRLSWRDSSRWEFSQDTDGYSYQDLEVVEVRRLQP